MDVLSRVHPCDSGQGLNKSTTVKHALYWAAQARGKMSNPKIFRNVLQCLIWFPLTNKF